MSRPNLRALEQLGVHRRLAQDLALVCQALAGKTVLSLSSRADFAEHERRQTLELLQALGLDGFIARPDRIEFASGGAIGFAGTEIRDRLRGASLDVVDGGHLLPDEWRRWLTSGGGEVW